MMQGRHSMTPMTSMTTMTPTSMSPSKVNNKFNNNINKKNITNSKYNFMTIVLICFCSSIFSFYLGIYIGWNMEHSASSASSVSSASSLTMSASSTLGLGGVVGGIDCDCNRFTNASPLATDFQRTKSKSQQQSQSQSRQQSLRKTEQQQVVKNTTTNAKKIDWEEIANKQQNYIDAMMEHEKQRQHQQQYQQQQQQQRIIVPNSLNRLDILQQNLNRLDTQHQQNQQQQQQHSLQQPQRRNSKRTRYFLPRGEYVNRTEFHNQFGKQLGVPIDKNEIDNDRVLILYSESKAYPNSNSNSNNSPKSPPQVVDENGNIPLDDAIKNCDFMHVVLTNQDRAKQCIAIMGQYESYHVHRFMRLPKYNKNEDNNNEGVNFKIQPINSSLPLRFVPRGMQQSGRLSHKIPSNKFQDIHWNDLAEYKSSLYDAKKNGNNNNNNNSSLSVMDELEPILRKVASYGTSSSSTANNGNNNNTVIILVCNFGQSELLMNFICNANSKGLSNILQKIILFATDQETYDLATSMGITSYYSEAIFKKMPKEAAKEYADDTFRLMMFAKVYCVHIVSQLGYNFLFQDVDVIWYKNPLDWFHNETNPDYHFDMFFQDDGSRALFYAPYAANTGFYYVRNNERTKYFFHSLLMSGDLIMATYSHQIALNALLSEHVSIYGLSVKICDRNDIEFPGGFWYHERHDLMKQYLLSSSSSSSSSTTNSSNKISVSLHEPHPYVFHFSWTDNKDNKIRFMEQMGEWYLEETCKSASWNDIINNTAAAAAAAVSDSVSSIRQHCCAVTPRMKCHYRDKPSKIPCYDSIPIDENGKSFW